MRRHSPFLSGEADSREQGFINSTTTTDYEVRGLFKSLYSCRPTFYQTIVEQSDGSFDLDKGEESIYHQYKIAIREAKRYIYIENQHICDEKLMGLILEALQR
jgi:hypothetical protein